MSSWMQKLRDTNPTIKTLSLVTAIVIGTTVSVIAAEDRYFKAATGDALATEVRSVQATQQEISLQVAQAKSDIEDQLVDFRIDYVEGQINALDEKEQSGQKLNSHERLKLRIYQQDLDRLYERKTKKLSD